MELRGKTVLITGAARRVGAAIVRRLAAAGCDIALHCHRSQNAAEETASVCRAAGVRVAVFCADLRDSVQVEELVPRTLERFGRLDVLINNAAIFSRGALTDTSLTQWEEVLRVNLTAPFLLSRTAATALRSAGGRIVNLCDICTARPWPAFLAYCVSKAGLEALTRGLAREFAPQINVVGIAPGVADWPDELDQNTRAALTAKIPLRRAGRPEDIAEAVHFVLRDGDYISGAIIPIDGGRSIS